MKMHKGKARLKVDIKKILRISLDDIMLLKTNLDLVFDDGIVLENVYYKDIIVYRFLVDTLVDFNIPFNSDSFITNFYTNGYFNNGTYLKLYSYFYRLVYEKYSDNWKNRIMDMFFKKLYVNIQMVNDKLIKNISEYVIGAEVVDVLELQFDEVLMESIAKCSKDPTPNNVTNTYNVLEDIMRGNLAYKDNPIRLLYLSRLVSIGQIRQLLASRGYVTEIDSKIFTIPMTNSFTLGFKNTYEAAIESRAGAKALYLSSKSISETEYTAREVQLATMVVERIEGKDCGHPTYTDFYIRPKEFDEYGDLIYKGDLENLVGKRYLDNNKEYIITGKEKHLEGTTIKLRSALYCANINKHTICEACVGELAHSVFREQNIGHYASTSVTSKVTQSLLSTKHLLSTAVSISTILIGDITRYMVTKGDKLLFKPNINNNKIKNVYLKLLQKEAWGLDTAKDIKDLFSININKITRLSELTLIIEMENKLLEIPVVIKNNENKRRKFFLSIDLISHILKNGYDVEDDDYYRVNITDFYKPKNIIGFYEKVEFNFEVLGDEFKKLIKSRKYKKVGNAIRSEYTPDILVQKIFELLNNKLSINIALIEIMVYAFTVRNLTDGNYDLGRNSSTRDVAGFKEVIDYRSVGSSYNWDNLQAKVFNPRLFLEKYKCSHPMDVFFAPNEVVKYEYDDELAEGLEAF